MNQTTNTNTAMATPSPPSPAPTTPPRQGTARTAAPAVRRAARRQEPQEGDIWTNRLGRVRFVYILSTTNGIVDHKMITNMDDLTVSPSIMERTFEGFIADGWQYHSQGPRVGYEAFGRWVLLERSDYIVEEVATLGSRLRVSFMGRNGRLFHFMASNFEYRPRRREEVARRNLAPALQNAGQREPQQGAGVGNNFPTFFETEQPNGARKLRLGETLTKADFLHMGNFYLEKKLILRNFEVISDDCDLMQGDKLYPIIVNKSLKEGADPWQDNAQVYCLTEIMNLLRENRDAIDPYTRKRIRTIHIMTEAEVEAWEKKIIRDMSAQQVGTWKERLVESEEELKRKEKKLEQENKMLEKKEEELKKEKERMKRKRKRSGGDGSGAGGKLSTSRSRFQALKL